MAILCRDINLLFIMAPRTGCTAIGELLCGQLGGEYLPAEDLVNEHGHYVLRKKHSTLDDLLAHGVLTREAASQLLKCAAVRNPFDSLVSLYVKKREKYQPLLADRESWIYRVPGYVDDMRYCMEHSFEDWVVRKYRQGRLRGWLRPRRRWLSDRFTRGVDVILRYERLQEDFDAVLRRAGVADPPRIPEINRTSERRSDFREYYTPRARRIVERAFRDELAHYGYSFA